MFGEDGSTLKKGNHAIAIVTDEEKGINQVRLQQF